MPGSNFARSCFEERFPKDMNTAELLESGELEGILLKSFKYITDLLINLNSLATEENNYERPPETPVNGPMQYSDKKMVSPRSGKGSTDETVMRKYSSQPSQEGLDFKGYDISPAGSEPNSALKMPRRSDYSEYQSNKNLYELEKSKNELQKIVGVPEEKDDKKAKKSHSRYYSSSIKGAEGNEVDEGKEIGQAMLKRDNSKHGLHGNAVSMSAKVEEDNFTSIVYARKKGSEDSYKSREEKEYRSSKQEKVPIEEQYRSKYGRSKQMSSSKVEKDVSVKGYNSNNYNEILYIIMNRRYNSIE